MLTVLLDIARSKFMAFFAMRLSAVTCWRTEAAQNIFPIGYGFKMVRIHTASDSAKMV